MKKLVKSLFGPLDAPARRAGEGAGKTCARPAKENQRRVAKQAVDVVYYTKTT